MLEKLSNSWELAKASAGVLRADKELLLFPLVSGIALIVVSASFFMPLVLTGAGMEQIADGSASPLAYVVLFLFYFVQYFVIVFFNTALVGAAMIRFDGGDPGLGDGLRVAMSRLGPIAGYALLAATVGLALRILRERVKGLGSIVVGLFGMAWSLATFLVVPVLAVRGVGPIEAVKESSRILKRTWGEQIAGNFGLGAIFFLIFVSVFMGGGLLIALLATTGQPVLVIPAVILLVVALLLVMLVQAALSGIYAAALYRFATTGEVAGFERRMLTDAFVAK